MEQGRATRTRYFLSIAVVMVVINVVGFAPSFLLRPVLDGPFIAALDPPGVTVIAHGSIFLGWIALFAVQAHLIQARRVKRHRSLGVLGGVLAVAMVVSGCLVLRKMLGVILAADQDSLPFATQLAVGNGTMLVLFSVFVTLGLYWRRRPAAHKRLMLLATLSMMPQSLGRLGRLEVLAPTGERMVNEMIWAFGGLLILFASLYVHDFRARGRPHRVTVVGPIAILGVMIGAGVAIPQLDGAQSVVAALFG